VTARVTPGDEVTPFKAAVMVVLPEATPLARPEELMVAKPVLVEFQVAELVIFGVVSSE
jgi:hypothetical protein